MEASLYLQSLTPTTAAPILELDGDVFGTENTFGKGRAILIGTVFGLSVTDDQPSTQALLTAILKNTGVLPDRHGRLLKRRRDFNNQAAWFLFNPTRQRMVETVKLETFTKAEDLLASTLPVSNGAVRVAVEPLDICCLLLS